jgi:toxin-antitoxin system PIN domain toxin
VSALLDGNVLVALSVADHVHHHAAALWFAGQTETFATTPLTQGTLLRVLMREGTEAADAMAVLDRLLRHPRHEFWPDDVPYDTELVRGVVGHRQVTDAYLVGLARSHSGRVATFDQGMLSAHPDATLAIDAPGSHQEAEP